MTSPTKRLALAALARDRRAPRFTNLCKRNMDKHLKRPYDQAVKLEPVIFADFCDPKSSAYVEMQDAAEKGIFAASGMLDLRKPWGLAACHQGQNPLRLSIQVELVRDGRGELDNHETDVVSRESCQTWHIGS